MSSIVCALLHKELVSRREGNSRLVLSLFLQFHLLEVLQTTTDRWEGGETGKEAEHGVRLDLCALAAVDGHLRPFQLQLQLWMTNVGKW